MPTYRLPWVLALVLGACDSAVMPPPDPAQLVVLKAAPAKAIPGGTIDTISVRLLSASGQPVPGYPVTWSGDGVVTPLDAVTDDLGLAHARWELPSLDLDWIPRPLGPSGAFAVQAAVGGIAPVSFSTLAQSFTVDQMDAESNRACGVRDGELWCWGAFLWESRRPEPVDVVTGLSVSAVRVTDARICVLSTAGDPWCTPRHALGPFARVAGVPPLRGIDKGSLDSRETSRFCGRALGNESSWCWHFVGDADAAVQQVSSTPFRVLEAGGDFWCGLDASGDVWCQGENDSGQLGDGTLQSRSVAGRVVGLPPVVSLSADHRGACAAESDGTIWCWGFGPNVPGTSVPVPVAIPGIRGTNITVGGTGDGYLLTGGAVRLWWGNTWHQFPFNIADYGHVDQVSGGGQACIRTTTSEVFCSWILAYGGGDSSPFPSALVPLPPIVE